MVLKNPSKYELNKTIVYLVRHGDRIHVPGNKEIGLEIPGPGLSNLGKQQARGVAKQFAKIKDEVDVLYSSSMTRAIETAEEISKVVKKKIIISKELCEFNHLLWEKKVYHKTFWKHYSQYRKALKKFDEILVKNRGKVIVIVAHGNVIRGLIGKKLKLSFKHRKKLEYNNCHVTLIRFMGKKLDHLQCYNNANVK